MATAHWSADYKRRRTALARQRRATCCICHGALGPIRYDLGYPHPLSFSAEHVVPVHRTGSDSGPLEPAHLGCNSAAGARYGNQQRAQQRAREAVPEPRSSTWL